MEAKFEVKQFSSGEYDVKLINRISESEATIHWNWFKEKDFFLQLLKIDAIRNTYGERVAIILEVPYLPYARQDRVFEAGQGVPYNKMVQTLLKDGIRIRTQGLHTKDHSIDLYNELVTMVQDPEVVNVFPDKSAEGHYYTGNLFSRTAPKESQKLFFNKVRRDDKVISELEEKEIIIPESKKFIIYDDICAGGRTFVNAANALRKKYGNDINIELTVYHAFLDHGISDLLDSGISRINIINKDSYEYIESIFNEMYGSPRVKFSEYFKCINKE